MTDFILRTLMAAFISILGMMATHMWSKSQQVKLVRQDAKPVAYIKTINNEVQRRPANRLIWQHVYPGQELFAGEAVRTAGDAETEIEFIGQQVTVRLDPYSVIEIEESSSGLNLDFLKGNLFIVSKAETSTLTIASGDQKVAVGQSEIQVSKTSAAEQMAVDVYKGKPQLISQGQAQALPELRKLKILHPRPGEVAYVKPDSEETVRFEWEAVDSDYQVYLQTGKSQDDLKTVTTAPASGSSGRIDAKIEIGKGYYRLVARSNRADLKEIRSLPTRYDVRAKVAPVLFVPALNTIVQPSSKQTVTFEWSNPGELERLILEIASTKDLKSKIYSEEIGRSIVMEIPAPDVSGPLYWRVSGRLPGTQTLVSSPVQQFYMRNKGKNQLQAPTLIAPENAHVVSFLAMRDNGVTVSWKPLADAKSYTFSLIKDGAEKAAQQDMDTKNTELTLRDLKQGVYQWHVTATDEFGETTQASERRTFTIEGVSVLAWGDGFNSVKTVYKTKKPIAKLTWQRGPQQAKSWRIRMLTTREPADNGGWITLNLPYYEARPEDAGTFYFEAEALDEKGEVIGRTATRTHEFVQAEPPPAPRFTDDTPTIIDARDDGSIEIAWVPVADAREYVVIMKSKEGAVVGSQKTKSNRVAYTKLKPGAYTISLQSIDGIGRTGPEGEARELRVPEYSDVEAPKLRGVNVK